jgi:predicted lysophospholipase L1 biosynthesis ABC-type transport system permease subunit
VAIVSDSVAADLWPHEEAIGRRISMKDHPGPEDWLTIVGVASDVRQMTLAEPARRAIYLPVAQTENAGWLRKVSFIARVNADAPGLPALMRTAFREVDPNQPPPDVLAMTDLIGRTTATPRFQTWLLLSFAAMALGLTLVGVYALLAYAVSRRTREFGVRVALGADTSRIVWLVAGRTLRLLLAGIALGTAGALATTRLLQAFLFDVTPTDPATFAVVAALLALAGLSAAAVPAWRAARVDPTRALHAE